MSRRARLVLAALGATACVATGASAQDANDIARAEALFHEGTKQLEAGNLTVACPKFADSQLLVRGIGVTLYLAECYERQGRTMSAWIQFRQAERLAEEKGDKRASVAHARAARLDALVPTVTVNVAPGSDVAGLVIKRDGIDVVRGEWGVAEPVDPGPHTVTATAPGRTSWQSNIQALTAKENHVVDVALSEPVRNKVDARAPEPDPAAGQDESRDPGHTRNVLAVASLGVGAAGVALGCVFGLVAWSKFKSSEGPGGCMPNDECTTAGLDRRRAGINLAAASDVAFAVGALGATGSLIFYISAPRAAVAVAPSVGPRDAALTFRAGF